MNAEERDRLVRVEERTKRQAEQLDSIEEKLDQLVQAAAMGKGAWWLLLKIGGFLVVVGGAAGWLYDRFLGGVSPHP